jgi:lysophospholipase L1-like esterase
VVTFDGLEYIASYADLSAAFGPNEDAGAAHFIQSGRFEGRTVTFDGLDYIASYADLRAALGANSDAGSIHFITNGRAENRAVTFDGLEYVASYNDLASAFGPNAEAGAAHFIARGAAEGRDGDSFSAWHYLHNYTDLLNAFGNNVEGALGAGTGGNIPDPQHEGVSGRTALELISQVTSIVNANHPDAVLLMIGTNDIINLGASADVTVSRIVSVVNNIHAVDSSIHVLVAGLLPTSRPEGGQIAPANAGLIRAIDSLEAQGRAVSFVDTSAITLADLSDGVHPSAAGHAELAGIWFDAIQDEVPHPSGDFLF